MAQVEVLRTAKLPTEGYGHEAQRKIENPAKSMPPPQYKPPPSVVEDRRHSGDVRKYYVGKLIGKGGFARVYLVTDAQNGEVMAGKIVDKSTLVKARHRQKLASEVKIHKSLDHHHVVKLENVFEDDNRVYLLMELCHNKSMMDLIRRRKRLTASETAYYMLQIIDSLEYMHGKCVIHRDLKLGNIFLNSKMEVKIGDFGLAAQLMSPEERKRTICGTPNYIAPEILEKTGHGFEADIWSLGVVLYTLLIGKPPFETSDVKTTYRRIRANSYSFPSNVPIPDHAKNLIQRILHTDPARRPKLAEIRAHPFFSERPVPRQLPATALVKVPVNFIDEKNKVAMQDENMPLNENRQQNQDQAAYAVEMPLVPTPERRTKRTRVTRSPSRETRGVGLFGTLSPGEKREPLSVQQTETQKVAEVAEKTEEMKVSGESRSSNGVIESLDQEDRAGFSEMHSRIVLGFTQSNSPTRLKARETPTHISPTVSTEYVSAWVDYSSKYGLGYQLCDGTIGVHFNDWSKMALSPDESFVQYFPGARDKDKDMKVMKLNSYPVEMKKKVLLLEMFKDYLQGPSNRKRKARPKSNPNIALPFVKRWMKTQQAIIFKVSTGTFQLNFYDHSKVIFNGDASAFLYIDKEKQQKAAWVSQLHSLQNPSLNRRIKFAKDVLWYLLRKYKEFSFYIMDLPQSVMILGAQWGDEGKGKLVDILSSQFDYCCRCAGGSNAGHTIVVGEKKFAFHLMPSGVLHEKVICVIGNGVVVHLPTLMDELKALDDAGINYKGRILISDRAHLLFELHRVVDGLREEELHASKIGTTKRGIGPCYATKANRDGLRAGDLLHFDEVFVNRYKRMASHYRKRFGDLWPSDFDETKEIDYYADIIERIKPMIVDSAYLVNSEFKNGKRLMIEGANAALLDIDFGTYPYVTSSNTIAGGAVTGLGVSARKMQCLIGIVKAYTTRVGMGPFPTEDFGAAGDHLGTIGHEFGTTTGRKRRCGWLDMMICKFSHMINEYQYICLTKLDVMSGLNEIKIAVEYSIDGKPIPSFPASLEDLAKVQVKYETMEGWKEDITNVRNFQDLPVAAQNYVKRIEEILDCPIRWIGVGPARDAIIERK